MQISKARAPVPEHVDSDLSDDEISGEDLDMLQQYGGRLSFLRDLDTSDLQQCVPEPPAQLRHSTEQSYSLQQRPDLPESPTD